MIHMHRDYLPSFGYGTAWRRGIYVSLLRKQLVSHDKKHQHQAHDKDLPPSRESRPLVGFSPYVSIESTPKSFKVYWGAGPALSGHHMN
jgi:hypothetical protein